jgi:hypothetical protein
MKRAALTLLIFAAAFAQATTAGETDRVGRECLITQSRAENGNLSLATYSNRHFVEEFELSSTEHDPFLLALNSVKNLKKCQIRPAKCSFHLEGISNNYVREAYTVFYYDSANLQQKIPTLAENIDEFADKLNLLYDSGVCERPKVAPVCFLYIMKGVDVLYINDRTAETFTFDFAARATTNRALELGLCSEKIEVRTAY